MAVYRMRGDDILLKLTLYTIRIGLLLDILTQSYNSIHPAYIIEPQVQKKQI